MHGPIIALSALKHAYRHPVRAWDLGDGFTMIVGPNQAAILLEVGYPHDELDVKAMASLRAAVIERSEAERHLLEAVRTARESGMSWSAIGSLVGTTGEAARQRYSNKVA